MRHPPGQHRSRRTRADEADSNLTTSWIDPAAETQRYIDAKLEHAEHLDQAARVLEEELRSPCTEELAVFVAFSNLIRRGRTEHVVIDTAPTGHTLLLLDQTGSYHHDVMRTSTGVEGRAPHHSCASRTPPTPES